MLRYVNYIRHLSQSFSTKSAPILELLKERTLLRVSGNDVSEYLQGLVTNDMKHLMENGSCMYAMFLNTKGRVLYDTIIYATKAEDTFLIECDTNAVEPLRKHLLIYKLRKKINIENLTNDYSVHVIFNPDHLNITEGLDFFNKNVDSIYDILSSSSQVKTAKEFKIFNDMSIYRDPRISLLGSRVVAPKNKNVEAEISKLTHIKTQNSKNYRWFRYNLGVGEGMKDLPRENCFPLEANCDYLHGVSFHKGCYIGQELTARTYHTGVVRKRLMPLNFSKIPTSISDENIINNNVNLGKLRGVEGDTALALLRIAKSLDIEIKIGDGVAKTQKPIWWPIEAPKEKLSAQKSE